MDFVWERQGRGRGPFWLTKMRGRIAPFQKYTLAMEFHPTRASDNECTSTWTVSMTNSTTTVIQTWDFKGKVPADATQGQSQTPPTSFPVQAGEPAAMASLVKMETWVEKALQQKKQEAEGKFDVVLAILEDLVKRQCSLQDELMSLQAGLSCSSEYRPI